jgi:hypothetical protein
MKRLEWNDALKGIHSLPMQKIFTKRDAKYSKKVSGTRFLEEKYLKSLNSMGIYICYACR